MSIFFVHFERLFSPCAVHLEVKARAIVFEEFDHDFFLAGLGCVQFVFLRAPDTGLALIAEGGRVSAILVELKLDAGGFYVRGFVHDEPLCALPFAEQSGVFVVDFLTAAEGDQESEKEDFSHVFTLEG
jgi:hypothetical protein